MIQIKMQGRLGNQLFQYAYAKKLQTVFYPDEEISIIFPPYYKKRENGFEDSLQYFQTKYQRSEHLKLNFFQKILLYSYLIFRKIMRKLLKQSPTDRYNLELHFVKLMNFFGIYILSIGFYNFKNSKFKNKVLIGPFESDKYFYEIQDILRKEFQPKDSRIKENKRLYEQIENSESICISIRRGDFLADQYRNSFYVCTPDYFEKAITEIKKRVPNGKFIVFSDDVKWCKENMKFPPGTCYESGNDPVWEKLRLMSCCKHFIISNSTFSWWAQYLSENHNKVVIAPSRWKNVESPRDIYQNDWILIDP